jgi:hypothetical protein
MRVWRSRRRWFFSSNSARMRPLLGAEVVVELAQRHAGLLGDLAGRQARVAVGQKPAAGGVEDQRAGAHGRGWIRTRHSLPVHPVGRLADLDIA